MKTNQKASRAPVSMKTSAYDNLRRTIMASLLFEDSFYEDGESAATRVARYMNEVSPEQARAALKEAKEDNKLRHMPLYLLILMAKRGILTSKDVENTVTRVDDMAELLALYQRDTSNKHMIPHSIQKGIAKAFPKFDEYQLGKYKGDKDAIKLRDVIRLAHPKPENDEQSKLWKKVVDGTLATPDTWEVALSATKDKKAEWTRLLTEKTDKGQNKLGALALLRNLRGMQEAGVDNKIIREAIKSASVGKILPFQFLTAARYAPNMSDLIEKKFFESMDNVEKLHGSTAILIDRSGSMSASLSNKGDTRRCDVAGALGAIARATVEDGDEVVIYGFEDDITSIPSHLKGFALAHELAKARGDTRVYHSVNHAVAEFKAAHNGTNPDRVIVITDEQDNGGWYDNSEKLVNLPKKSHGYMVNVGTYEHGIKYNKNSGWTTISGWSDSLIKYISKAEAAKVL